MKLSLSIYKTLILCVLTLVVINGCQRKKSDYQPPIDNSEVKEIAQKLNTQIARYDIDLANLSTDSLYEQLSALQPKYPFFLGTSPINQAGVNQIKQYLNDPIIKKLYKETNKIFADCSFLEIAFDSAFSLLKYHYPETHLPHIYTAITGLYYEEPISCYDSVMVIALDLYLGSNYSLYKQLGPNVPQYVYRRFSKEYILPDCMKELAFQYIDFNQSSSVLEEMLIEGKRLMFAEIMLPNTSDTLIFGFSKEKIQWAIDNESEIWSYLINNELLFNKNKVVVRKLIGDAPFTSYFPKTSPGRIGSWIGWQICRSWIINNPKRPIKELFLEKDAQKVLKESKYKPKK